MFGNKSKSGLRLTRDLLLQGVASGEVVVVKPGIAVHKENGR